MKINLWIYWLSCVSGLAMQIGGYCLKEPPKRATMPSDGGTRFLWQLRQTSGFQAAANSDSCNGMTILRPTADSNVAKSQFNGSSTIQPIAATHAVALANYVYQCAVKRAASPSADLATNSEKGLQRKHLGHEQQMTIPTTLRQLSKSWHWN